MYDPNADAPIFNAVPPVVVATAVLIAAIEASLQLGEAGLVGGPAAVGWRLDMIERFGMYASAFQWMWENGTWPLEQVVRLVAYPFFHQGLADALLSAVFVLAIGKGLVERTRTSTFVAVFFGAAIVTGVVISVLMDQRTVIYGAWAPISGLIGALSWVLLLIARATGRPTQQAFGLLAVLGIIQVVFWAMFGGTGLLEFVVGGAAGFGIAVLLHPAIGEGPGYWLRQTRSR